MLEEEICTSCNMYTYLVVKWRRMMFISKMLKELPVHSDYVFFFFLSVHLKCTANEFF